MPEVLSFPVRGDKLRIQVEVEERLVGFRSPFQRIEIVRLHGFARALLLDGHIQLTEMDEFAYHESLVHPAAWAAPTLERALVIGGGDGGALRELLRHASLAHIDLVDIDPHVTRLTEQVWPELARGAFASPRVQAHHSDAFEFVKTDRAPYDLIILDSTDVYEEESGSLSEALFTKPFYEDCSRLLRPEGLLVTQADNPVFCPYSAASVRHALGEVFPKTGVFYALVPSFGGFSGFCWASPARELRRPSEVDWSAFALRYLNPTTLQLAFDPLPFASAAGQS